MVANDLTHPATFRLKAVTPYSFDLTVRKPAGWSFLTPYEVFEEGMLWTVMRVHSGEAFGLKLSSAGTLEKPELLCSLYSKRKLEAKERKQLLKTSSWMLSLEEDISPFYAMAKHDSLVSNLTEDLCGMRMTRNPDLFSRLILAVTLQMAPIKRSDQMMDLLITEYGERVRFDGKEIPYWPSAETIAKAHVSELRQKCKLGYRAKVLKGIAKALTGGFPSPMELDAMPPEKAKTKLMELKGIGEYSADIVSLPVGFALDIWSAKIFSLLLHRVKPESPRDEIPGLKKAAEERWGKWRGYVFTYVLNDLNNLSRKLGLNLTEL